jgi:F-type H+-transporting ATPase subunit b
MSGWTFAFQVVNFLILALVLYRFLFKPVAAMVARRQSEMDAGSKEAESAKQAADESRAHYEGEREKLRAERESLLGELRAQVGKERDQTIAQARAESAIILEAARAEVGRERVDAAGQLTDAAVGLAIDLAKRLLEQVGIVDVAETLLQRACDHIESMPAERLRALGDELKGAQASLEVATSPALPAEAEARWAERIARDLDAGAAVKFVADAALIAGAELRFPHTKISFCWRDGLRAAREELVHHADAR